MSLGDMDSHLNAARQHLGTAGQVGGEILKIGAEKTMQGASAIQQKVSDYINERGTSGPGQATRSAAEDLGEGFTMAGFGAALAGYLGPEAATMLATEGVTTGGATLGAGTLIGMGALTLGRAVKRGLEGLNSGPQPAAPEVLGHGLVGATKGAIKSVAALFTLSAISEAGSALKAGVEGVFADAGHLASDVSEYANAEDPVLDEEPYEPGFWDNLATNLAEMFEGDPYGGGSYLGGH